MARKKKTDLAASAEAGLTFLKTIFDQHELSIQVVLDPHQPEEWVFVSQVKSKL